MTGRESLFDSLRHAADVDKDVYIVGAEDETLTRLFNVVEAARAFVQTTSVFRQQKASRDEFEALALALIEVGAFS